MTRYSHASAPHRPSRGRRMTDYPTARAIPARTRSPPGRQSNACAFGQLLLSGLISDDGRRLDNELVTEPRARRRRRLPGPAAGAPARQRRAAGPTRWTSTRRSSISSAARRPGRAGRAGPPPGADPDVRLRLRLPRPFDGAGTPAATPAEPGSRRAAALDRQPVPRPRSPSGPVIRPRRPQPSAAPQPGARPTRPLPQPAPRRPPLDRPARAARPAVRAAGSVRRPAGLAPSTVPTGAEPPLGADADRCRLRVDRSGRVRRRRAARCRTGARAGRSPRRAAAGRRSGAAGRLGGAAPTPAADAPTSSRAAGPGRTPDVPRPSRGAPGPADADWPDGSPPRGSRRRGAAPSPHRAGAAVPPALADRRARPEPAPARAPAVAADRPAAPAEPRRARRRPRRATPGRARRPARRRRRRRRAPQPAQPTADRPTCRRSGRRSDGQAGAAAPAQAQVQRPRPGHRAGDHRDRRAPDLHPEHGDRLVLAARGALGVPARRRARGAALRDLRAVRGPGRLPAAPAPHQPAVPGRRVGPHGRLAHRQAAARRARRAPPGRTTWSRPSGTCSRSTTPRARPTWA